ncbi:MAG TPA: hypothetical protein VMW36_10845 [Patescibacteria group bacterium]|nr:hypothetical protein [Patescibacteria group bacterium]
MYFTFSKEAVYGQDTTSQDYVLELVSEEIIENVNYSKIQEFNHPTSLARIPGINTVDGRCDFEITYGNDAWPVFFEVLLGQRVRIANVAFARSYERWNIITGQLTAALNTTDTTFTITEYKDGEFDNVDGVIINSEYISISSIADGAVSLSQRGQEGTTAALHAANALVYGVVSSGGRNVDIISRYRDGYCYFLPESITAVVYRAGDYFKFNGIQFRDMVFKADPQNGVDLSADLIGRLGGPFDFASPSLTVDSNPMLDTDHFNVFSMGEHLGVLKMDIQVSNTLNQGPAKILDTTYQALVLRRFATYGQFTAEEDTLEYYNAYKDNDAKNMSITACNGRGFTQAYVFALNDIKWGTMQHVLRGTRLITDSIPFYCYGEDSFTIMVQT